MSLDRKETVESEVSNLAGRDESPDVTPSRRRWWVLGGLIAAAAAAGWFFIIQQSGSTDVASATGPLSTGQVVRTDLVQTESLDGILGRLDGDPVPAGTAGTVTTAADPGQTVRQGEVLLTVDANPVVLMYGETPAFRDLGPTEDTIAINSRGNGTVTSVVESGTSIVQGDVLYSVNGEPVAVLYGEVPSYRTLQDARTDLQGDDILQLEQALTDLGYNGGTVTVDGTYTGNTAAMVEDWQADIGATTDGSVDLGEVVFIPGPAVVIDVGVAVQAT